MKYKFRHKNLLRVFVVIFVFFSYNIFSVSAQENDSTTVSSFAKKKLKIKLAVGRFSNETNYGRSLLRDGDLDPLGKQAADILTAYLTRTNSFLIFERPDLSKIKRELNQSGGEQNIIGVDTLILGSIVEFGRTTDGKRGMFNKKKVQRAHAKVAIRLVDVRTGLVFHSATGQGDATTESATVLGMGSTSKYDATLNDKAISLAIEDMIDELLTSLSGRSWKTDILYVENDTVYISGGKHQGLQSGDRLLVMEEGRTIRSKQSGFDITLPAKKVAELEVISTFGETEVNEGSMAKIISGQIESERTEKLFVTIQ